MPLVQSINVIWYAYRSIAETKIFRLGATLICRLYTKEVVKKLYFRKMKYITSDTKNFEVHLREKLLIKFFDF